MEYKKKALTVGDQITLLQARGLVISDPDRAVRWLRRVSFYHLGQYFPPYQAEPDVFRSGTTFEQVTELYNFDRKLRLLLLDAIERIEIAMRTHVTYELGHAFGPFGYRDAANFKPHFNHGKFMDGAQAAISQSHEEFINPFFQKYSNERHLPLWMLAELMSFGLVSQLYGGLTSDLKTAIAQRYSVPAKLFGRWLHTLSYVRNVCAHHCRLWNRQLAVRPSIPRVSLLWPYEHVDNARIYCIFIICSHLLESVAPGTRWRDRLVNLLKSHPHLDLAAMGIPSGYEQLAPWDRAVLNSSPS